MPMPAWWLLALPLLAGAMLPLQAGMNGEVARQLSSVMYAALVSFAVGTLALLCIVLLQRDPPTAAYAAPGVGAALFMAALLAGQLRRALLLDQVGWAGYRQAPISLSKVGGMLLVFTGVWLIRRG